MFNIEINSDIFGGIGLSLVILFPFKADYY